MTKAELQDQIAALQRVIDRQKREADLRAGEYVLMTVPHAGGEGSTRMCHAPYTPDIANHKEDSFRKAVLPILFSMLRAHSMPMDTCHGVYPKASVKFLDDGDRGGEHLVVPKGIAELIVDLANAVGDYGMDCYRMGIDTASDMLHRLASGETSAQEYEDRLTRERINECQSYRRFRIRVAQ